MAKFVVEKIWVTLNLLISQVIIKQRTSSFDLRESICNIPCKIAALSE